MSLKSLIVIAALAVLPVLLPAPPAAAQPLRDGMHDRFAAPYNLRVVRARPRRPSIEINPRPLLYRRCTDWYELQKRPSGTVLFPRYRCWWVRG
jgi:hypothetical protein